MSRSRAKRTLSPRSLRRSGITASRSLGNVKEFHDALSAENTSAGLRVILVTLTFMDIFLRRKHRTGFQLHFISKLKDRTAASKRQSRKNLLSALGSMESLRFSLEALLRSEINSKLSALK